MSDQFEKKNGGLLHAFINATGTTDNFTMRADRN